MPDRTQDLKNHRQVAVACKNYTDKEIKASEERILSIVVRNNVRYIDHTNEPTYRFTAPLNSKLLMLQSIAGNSNKIAPSTPSDDSVSRLKTIPENTYKSQIDYIGGKSVKYNQLVQNGNFVDSTGWLINATFGTSSVANNKLTYTITTKNASQSIATASGYRADIISGHKYFLSGTFTISQNATVSFEFDASTTINTFGNVNANTRTTLTTIKEISISTTNKGLYFYPNYSGGGLEVGATAIFENIILIDLTDKFGAGNEPSTVETAIPLLKANGYKLDGTDTYSTGELKHAIVSGVKYGSKNLINLLNVNQTTRGGITYKVDNNKITFNGTATETLYLEFDLINPISASDDYYSIALFNDKTSSGLYVYGRDLASQGVYNFTGYMSSVNFSKSNFQLVNGLLKFNIRVDSGTTINNFEFTPMLIKGTTAPSTYIPYVVPITKAIPNEVLADVRYGLGYDNTNYNRLDIDRHLRGSWDIVDLGSLNDLSLRSGETHLFQCGDIRNIIKKPPYTNIKANIICTKYNETTTDEVLSHIQLSIAVFPSGYIGIYDENYSTVEAFKTAMSGVYLVYELETAFDQDYSQYFDTDWNKVDLDKLYATCEMVVDEPIDMPNKVEYYGTIIHSLATAVKQEGFNIWDEELEIGTIGEGGVLVDSTIEIRSKNYINVLPNTVYYLNTPDVMIVHFWDENFNYIKNEYIGGARTYTTPINARYMKFRMISTYGTSYKNDICINISNQDLNGTYKSYKAPITRLLPNSQEKYSWGITDGVRNTRVFCDDECNPVNEGQLDVGNQDLGTLDYRYNSSAGFMFATISDIKSITSGIPNALITNNYTLVDASALSVASDKSYTTYTAGVYFKDSAYTDTTLFKNHFFDDKLLYQKNTTDTETLDDFDFSFDCEEGDTFTIIGCELLQCYATYSFLIKEAKSNE